jgi:hypothetical protein
VTKRVMWLALAALLACGLLALRVRAAADYASGYDTQRPPNRNNARGMKSGPGFSRTPAYRPNAKVSWSMAPLARTSCSARWYKFRSFSA